MTELSSLEGTWSAHCGDIAVFQESAWVEGLWSVEG